MQWKQTRLHSVLSLLLYKTVKYFSAIFIDLRLQLSWLLLQLVNKLLILLLRRLSLCVNFCQRLFRLSTQNYMPWYSIHQYAAVWLLQTQSGKQHPTLQVLGHLRDHHSSTSILLLLVCVLWTIIGQPGNSKHLHLQSVARISHNSLCQRTGFDNVWHCLGLATRTEISVCKSPFPSAATKCYYFTFGHWSLSVCLSVCL